MFEFSVWNCRVLGLLYLLLCVAWLRCCCCSSSTRQEVDYSQKVHHHLLLQQHCYRHGRWVYTGEALPVEIRKYAYACPHRFEKPVWWVAAAASGGAPNKRYRHGWRWRPDNPECLSPALGWDFHKFCQYRDRLSAVVGVGDSLLRNLMVTLAGLLDLPAGLTAAVRLPVNLTRVHRIKVKGARGSFSYMTCNGTLPLHYVLQRKFRFQDCRVQRAFSRYSSHHNHTHTHTHPHSHNDEGDSSSGTQRFVLVLLQGSAWYASRREEGMQSLMGNLTSFFDAYHRFLHTADLNPSPNPNLNPSEISNTSTSASHEGEGEEEGGESCALRFSRQLRPVLVTSTPGTRGCSSYRTPLRAPLPVAESAHRLYHWEWMHTIRNASMALARRYGIPYLDTYPLLSLRPDAIKGQRGAKIHLPLGARYRKVRFTDCLHHCVLPGPYDELVRVLYAMVPHLLQ